MRFGHDVGKGSKQIDAKGSGAPTPTRRHHAQQRADELLCLRVLEQPYPRVHTPPPDARAIGDSDRSVLPQTEVIVAPPVPDDVPGPLAIDRPVTGVVADLIRGEVGLHKILPELFRESDFIFAGQRVALTSQNSPDVFKVRLFSVRIIAHSGHSHRRGPGAETGPVAGSHRTSHMLWHAVPTPPRGSSKQRDKISASQHAGITRASKTRHRVRTC